MTTTRKWFNLSDELIEIYPQSEISYQYKKLPLQYFLIAQCPFGGPIAILYNKFLGDQINQIKLPLNYDKSILIFNSKGELKKTISFDLKDRTILFKFTSLEELIIVYANGQYSLIDPFSGKRINGNYFKQGNQLDRSINQRCVGAVIDPNDCLYILKEKQLGMVKSVRGHWTPLTNLKPNIENPVFTTQNMKNSKRHAFTVSNSPYPAIYLSRQNTIQEFTPSMNIKRTIFEHDYLSKNFKNLLWLSKRQNILVLIFKKPFKIFYVTLICSAISSFKSAQTPTQIDYEIHQHDPILQLKQPLQINKKKSRHNYMTMNDQIIWLGQSSSICMYNNGKILTIFDDKNIKVIYNPSEKDNKMLHVVIEQIDGFRVIGEYNQIYREVSLIYQELVSLQSLQENQRNLFNYNNQSGMKLKKQLEEKISQQLTQQKNIQQIIQTLTIQQKCLTIHQLHQIYRKYINKQLISISELNELRHYVKFLLKQIVENGIKCLDRLELIKILKFATFVQNYYTNSTKKIKRDLQSKENHQEDNQNNNNEVVQDDDSNKLNKLNTLDKLDKLNKLNKLDQQQSLINNLASSLQTPIHELCSELRVINSLKYSYLKRFLTVQQFHYLKYEIKQKFISILLRYNMHYELDLIFGDSETKAKIFYHWAKCKIEKQSNSTSSSTVRGSADIQAESVKSQSKQNSVSNNNIDRSIQSTDSFIYQSIIQKYDSLKEEFSSNNQLFSQLAKYCVDRNKLSLGLKLLQHEQNPQRRIIVGLLILVVKKDKSLVQKILQYTQKSKQSCIIYRVIKQLLNLKWIQRHLWTNIFHNKLKIQQHYIKYNEFAYMFDNNKDYYLQNKMLVDLGYMGIRQTISENSKEKIEKQDIVDLQKYPQQSIFNSEENQQVKQKIIKEYQTLIPTMCLHLKKHTLKTNTGLYYLRKLKTQPQPILQSDILSLQSVIKLNDKQLEYLGQIIMEKEKNKQLAIKVFCKIKSDKVYKILLKLQRVKQAIDLGYERNNAQKLREILQMIPDLLTVGLNQEFMLAYTRDKIRELQKRGLK